MRCPIVPLVLICLLGGVPAGCSQITCESICNECTDTNRDGCKNKCVDDYQSKGNNCRKALRALAECVEDQEACDETCEPQARTVSRKCRYGFANIVNNIGR